jgi:hypothetical protein
MKMAWILQCPGFAIMTVIPRKRLQRRRKERHPAVGMRVIDEESRMLLSFREQVTQRRKPGGGWQNPSVVRGATPICHGEVFTAHAYFGITAKVSGLLRCVCGPGNGNLAFGVRGLTTENNTGELMRCCVGLGLCQHLPHVADKPAAFKQSRALKRRRQDAVLRQNCDREVARDNLNSDHSILQSSPKPKFNKLSTGTFRLGRSELELDLHDTFLGCGFVFPFLYRPSQGIH